MALQRWRPFTFDRLDPVRDMMEVQSEMNRLWDSVFGPRSRPGAMTDRLWAPAVDIHETKDDLVVTAELPGVKEKDVQLSIMGETLSLRGQRTANHEVKEDNYHRIERWSGDFERHIQFPFPVQTDKVRASYRDGVLEIRLPKVEQVKPKEIKIEVG